MMKKCLTLTFCNSKSIQPIIALKDEQESTISCDSATYENFRQRFIRERREPMKTEHPQIRGQTLCDARESWRVQTKRVLCIYR